MSLSLYELSVANYLQILRAVDDFLDKGLAHCGVDNIDLHELVETRVHPDMLPLRFQLVSVVHHSLHAIKGIQAGVFSPPPSQPDLDFAALEEMVSDAVAELEQYTPEQINAFSGKDVVFKVGDMVLPFDAESFVMSFSLPNFHFHASTAYNILRSKGVPLGKRDFLGAMRCKQ